MTLWQRMAMRRLVKLARKRPGEPLGPEDWDAYFRLGRESVRWKRFLGALPSSPRCGVCSAPFSGFGARVVRPLGYRPSRKNPHLCSACVELAPPGGTTTDVGVMFADLRGFTALSENASPQEVSVLLRRFYACAEDVLFPEAIIDKLIGDEVMALYIPLFGQIEDPAAIMVAHARDLLHRIGYGTPEGPFVEVGIGLDFGEAFVGNIGDRAVYDFTAVGDVVNTAARLQAQARGGEILVAARLMGSDSSLGERTEVTVKGKAEPVAAYRIARPAQG